MSVIYQILYIIILKQYASIRFVLLTLVNTIMLTEIMARNLYINKNNNTIINYVYTIIIIAWTVHAPFYFLIEF